MGSDTVNEIVKPSEAARILGVDRRTVLTLFRNGDLPGWTIRRHSRFLRSEVEAYRDRNSNQKQNTESHVNGEAKNASP